MGIWGALQGWDLGAGPRGPWRAPVCWSGLKQSTEDMGVWDCERLPRRGSGTWGLGTKTLEGPHGAGAAHWRRGHMPLRAPSARWQRQSQCDAMRGFGAKRYENLRKKVW